MKDISASTTSLIDLPTVIEDEHHGIYKFDLHLVAIDAQ